MDAIATIATVPAIVALVNLAKGLGLSGKWSALVAVLLGVAVNLAIALWGSTAWFESAATGLILGLGAAGLYDLTPGDKEEPELLLGPVAGDLEINTDSEESVA